MNIPGSQLAETQRFRQVQPEFERIAPGFCRPRHCHFAAYVTILLEGQYEQASYAGRVMLEPGDVLVQPMLDRHESRVRRHQGLHLLRLAWTTDWSLGGVFKIPHADLVIRAAELGYSDRPHMTRAVRTLTGAPPDAWRKHLQR